MWKRSTVCQLLSCATGILFKWPKSSQALSTSSYSLSGTFLRRSCPGWNPHTIALKRTSLIGEITRRRRKRGEFTKLSARPHSKSIYPPRNRSRSVSVWRQSILIHQRKRGRPRSPNDSLEYFLQKTKAFSQFFISNNLTK